LGEDGCKKKALDARELLRIPRGKTGHGLHLRNFTTTYEGGDKGGKNNAEEDERDWRLERLEESKPPMLPTDFDIFVTKAPCDDCKAFQKRVSEVAGTNFNIKVLSPVEG
jgi:hypothetical protein